MKKIILFLLLSIAGYGQIVPSGQEQDFDYGIRNTASQLDDNAVFLTVQDATGVQGKSTASVWAKKIYVDNSDAKKQFLSTGLLKNGLLQANANTTLFDITAGTGIISNFDNPDAPTSNIIIFPAFTEILSPYLTTSNITYVAINSVPAVVMQASPFTDSQRRDLIILGAIVHSNLTTINTINNISAPSNADTNQLHDLMEAIGALNISGNKYSANGANLSLNKSAGDIFKLGINFANNWKDPHKLTIDAQTLLTLRYRTQNGTEGTDVTVLNPSVYDLNNVLTAVPSNRFSIQTVTLFQSGITRVQYGQNTYATMAEAEAAINTRAYVVEPNIALNGIARAYIILKNSTTSLQNASDAKIVEAQKFGGSTSGGVALTNTSIIAALGFTPANVADKQNSLAVDGSGTKYPTVDAVNKRAAFINVKEFGATGDGVTDASISIQNAINASPTTYIPVGTYIINATLSIPSNHTLIFEKGAKFKAKAGLNSWMMTNSDHIGGNSNIIIKGGEFDGNALVQTTFNSILYFKKVDNLNIKDSYVHSLNGNFGTDYDLGGLNLNTCSNSLISNVNASSNDGTALYVGTSSHTRIENGVFNNNTVTGINVDTSPDSVITGNTAKNNGSSGISINGLNNIVSNNYLEGNQFNVNVGHAGEGGIYVASGSVVSNNIAINGTFGIQVQTETSNVSVSNNTVYGNTNNYSGTSLTSFTQILNGASVGNLNPNQNAKINIGFNSGTIPAGTGVVTLGTLPFRWTNGDGNASSGSYFMGEGNKAVIGTRIGEVDTDVLTINGTEHKIKGTSIIDSGGSTSLNAMITGSGVNGSRMDFNSTLSGQNQNYRIGTNFLLNDKEFGIHDVTNSVSRLVFNKNGAAYFSGDINATSFNGSATLTGTPTAPTATPGTSTTQIATMAALQVVARPYKVYTALLSQTGTNAPTAIVQENTIGSIVWSRTVAGNYFATLSGAYTTDKTTVFITNGASNATYIHGSAVSTTNVNVVTIDDGQIDRATIEIRVYN